jgi:C4-dicarboxylate-specific signal transduction histidine kinase
MDLDTSVKLVLAQDTQIEQVMLNLVKNAVESMEEVPNNKRDLLIKTSSVEPNKVRIKISDSGCGMDKDMLDQAFDPFVTSKEQGMGLGLSISQGILEAHDDEIIITTNPEGGMSFSFDLPVVEYYENLEERKI